MTNSPSSFPNHTTAHAASNAAAAAARPGRGLRIAGWVAAAALGLAMIKWVLATVVLLAMPFAVWWVIDRAGRGRRQRAAEAVAVAVAVAAERAIRRRAEVESRAVVDAAGGCGWCGSRTAHRAPDGRLVMPREHHRADIEHTLATPPVFAPVSAAAA